MLSSTARRCLLKTNLDNLVVRQGSRFSSSMTPSPNNAESSSNGRREMHSSPPRNSDVTAAVAAPVEQQQQPSSISFERGSLANRFAITAEVTVSKIFPAGFGWQTASLYAERLGYEADSLAFALTTGVGDGIGVLLGHVAFYGTKKAVLQSTKIDMNKEMQTGLFLGTAAVFSGTAWQPLVNALQGANLSFMEVFAGTWIGCASAFYIGLRAGRTVFSGFLEHIEEPTYTNSLTDKSLSAAIGGATGCFVGTDAAYLPDQNFLIDVVGITDGTPDLAGCAIAGTSTSIGFVSAQSALNVVYPEGKCWND